MPSAANANTIHTIASEPKKRPNNRSRGRIGLVKNAA